MIAGTHSLTVRERVRRRRAATGALASVRAATVSGPSVEAVVRTGAAEIATSGGHANEGEARSPTAYIPQTHSDGDALPARSLPSVELPFCVKAVGRSEKGNFRFGSTYAVRLQAIERPLSLPLTGNSRSAFGQSLTLRPAIPAFGVGRFQSPYA
jgi:hypothetical protein